MNKRENVTLYNILFPIWFLIIFPVAWVVVLPANFVIDSLVLLISVKLVKLAPMKEIYRRTIIKVWLIGFASDFAGAGILFLGAEGSTGRNEYLSSLSWNPFDNWYAVLYTAFAVIVSALLIYLGNYKLSFGSLEAGRRKKQMVSLALAIFTAPYIFFYPSALINGTSWNELHFFTNHIVKRDEFRLEVTMNRDVPENVASEPIVLHNQETNMKVAVNDAERITRESAGNSEADFILSFYNRDYKGKNEIPIWVDDGSGYFQYRDRWYEMNRKSMQPFLKAIDDVKNTRGKDSFVIEPDPRESKSAVIPAVDKEGKKLSEYPVFEDSRYQYYCEDGKVVFDYKIKFENGESTDVNTALESGLITPRQLADYGFKLIAEPQ